MTKFAYTVDQILTTTSGLQVTIHRPYDTWATLISELQSAAWHCKDEPKWLNDLVLVIVVKVSEEDREGPEGSG